MNSFINLVFIFRCSSSPRNPLSLYVRRADPSTLAFSLSSHRHSYKWMSLNIHLKKSVWSTRISRITLIWNPLPNFRVRSYETRDRMSKHWVPRMLPCSRVIGTWNPRSLTYRDVRSSIVDIPTPRTHTSNSVQRCVPSPTTTLQ